jgi:hypothetical protein
VIVLTKLRASAAAHLPAPAVARHHLHTHRPL